MANLAQEELALAFPSPWQSSLSMQDARAHPDRAEATRAIVGQAAAMGIGIDTSKAAMGMLGSKYRHKAVDWNAKIALSVVKMLKCWKAKCSATGASSDLQIASGFGGGTEC